MKYPNALSGIKKLFAAEILNLLTSVLLLVSAVMVALMKTSEELKATLAIPTIICGAGAIVLMLMSYILSIVGVSRASKDEYSFTVALFASIFGLVFALCSGFIANIFNNNIYVERLISMIPDVINLVIMSYIVQGIRNLAIRLDKPVMEGKGRNIMTIVFVMVMVIFVVRVLAVFMEKNEAFATFALGALGFAGLLSAVSYVLYLIYLGKAKKMLADN